MSNNHSSSKTKYPAPFSLRLSDEERTGLEKLAGGVPLGTFIREVVVKVILEKELRPSPKKTRSIDQKLLAQLLGALGQSRIASNINQLAKAANSGSLPVNEDVLKSLFEAVKSIRWMRDTLIKGMKVKPHSKDEEIPDDPQR